MFFVPNQIVRMKVKSTGEIGFVYSTESGNEILDFDHDEGEGAQGWEQVSSDERQFVTRKRISHMCVMWVFETEEYLPHSHRTDGLLF